MIIESSVSPSRAFFLLGRPVGGLVFRLPSALREALPRGIEGPSVFAGETSGVTGMRRMSAFGGKVDMTFCGNPLLRSLLGGEADMPFCSADVCF